MFSYQKIEAVFLCIENFLTTIEWILINHCTQKRIILKSFTIVSLDDIRLRMRDGNPDSVERIRRKIFK